MQQMEPGRVLDTLLWDPLFYFILWGRVWTPLRNSSNKGVLPRVFSYSPIFIKVVHPQKTMANHLKKEGHE